MPGDKNATNGIPRVARPRTEDVERRLAGREGVERIEHHELRECLGHDDLPRDNARSNLSRIYNFQTGNPIREHGRDPFGQYRGATKEGEYVTSDEDDN